MGLAVLCYQLPGVCVGMFVGVFMDRFSRNRLMVPDNILRELSFYRSQCCTGHTFFTAPLSCSTGAVWARFYDMVRIWRWLKILILPCLFILASVALITGVFFTVFWLVTARRYQSQWQTSLLTTLGWIRSEAYSELAREAWQHMHHWLSLDGIFLGMTIFFVTVWSAQVGASGNP
ncbi:MAG: hypothetical protein K6T81_14345 [Alicyclobacillus macrosporangiidus]|uniref:hypothetical protein n=1 Tax=Alicyclobacillus macrosporangiidus TaxID=392015 RepID=UPI0026EDF746|nr:hypothetical protein [Alicyclobacillus macrosporangiidus]MCL6599896.1 hypothetical protein [Alicyclobacillus macrosporangiidus]